MSEATSTPHKDVLHLALHLATQTKTEIWDRLELRGHLNSQRPNRLEQRLADDDPRAHDIGASSAGGAHKQSP